MRSYGTAFTLLSLGLLSGCTAGTPVTAASEKAPQPQQIAHNYQLYGVPGAYMVDSQTGKVWELKKEGAGEKFVAVSVQQNDAPRYFNSETGKIQDTPANVAQEHPTGKMRRYNPQTGKIE